MIHIEAPWRMEMEVPSLLFVVSAAALLLHLSQSVVSLNPDGLSLLALKSAVSSDPMLIFSSWKDSDPSPCNWSGIECVSGRVSAISLPNMGLSGYIPSEIGFLRFLTNLSVPHNNFSHSIPSQLFQNASSLAFLDLSHNSLTGPIPQDVQSLQYLTHIDLSSNLLNGSLPSSLSHLPNLSGTLNLSHNSFSGSVPDSFGKFPVGLSLDLSQNNLTGPIPQLGSLMNQGPTAFAGNPGLCGFPVRSLCPEAGSPVANENGILLNPKQDRGPISPSSGQTQNQTGKGAVAGRISAPIVLSGLLFMAAGALMVSMWLVKKRLCARGKGEGQNGKVGQQEDTGEEQQKGEFVVVDEEEGCFGVDLEELLRASAYVVGKSRNGIVYKVVVGRGVSVAVRRLGEGCCWKQKELQAEAEAIARVCHPNIVRLRAYYYAADEKLLVTDFIPNGSLHSALHGGEALNSSSPTLSWAMRLKIAQGAASGLAHLHECIPRKYVHGNMKSSKILLDDDFNAYISGFGLNRLAFSSATCNRSPSPPAPAPHQLMPSSSASGVASKLPTSTRKTCLSYPYLAPEAKAKAAASSSSGSSSSKLTQKCDVYSFGIVLLEMVTGRLPDDGLEGFVRRAFREERPLAGIVDPLLLREAGAKKQVLAVFHVALGCTEIDPDMRPRMKAVSEKLHQIG